MLRISRIVLGTLLVLLGLIGFFLPILQGWLFVGLGMMLLYRDVPYVRRIVNWLKTLFPQAARFVENFKPTPAWLKQEVQADTRREEKQRRPEP